MEPIASDFPQAFESPSELLASLKPDFIDTIPASLLVIDRAYRIVLTNKPLRDWMKRNEQEMRGQPCYRILHARDTACPDCPATVTFRTGQVARISHTGLDKDGATTYVNLTTQAIKNDRGEALYVLEYGADLSELMRVQRALEQSETHYRELFENASLAMFQSTPEGEFLAVNPEFARLFGYGSPAEVAATVKNAGAEMFADPQRRAEIVSLQAERPDLKEFETLYKRKDGSTFWGKLNLRSVLDPKGCVRYFEGFIENITERKQTEAALQSREAYLRAIMNNIPHNIWLKDREGVYLAVNSSFLRAIGKEKEEDVIGKTDIDLWPLDLAQKYRADDDVVMASRQQIRVEERAVFQNVESWVETFKTAILDQIGQPVGTTGIALDITERKQAEEVLRQSEERLLRAQRIGQVGNWDWNLLTDELYWSAENYRIYGLSPEVSPSLEGFWATVDPLDLAMVTQALEEALSGRKPFDLDMRILRPDGARGAVHTQAEITFDDSGKPVRMFGTVQDIAQRKQAEETIRESEARLKRAHKAAKLGSWEWDLITKELYWAEGNYSLHGSYPDKTKPSYDSFLAVVDPAEREYVTQALAAAIAGTSAFEIDYTVIRPDNGERCVIHSKADVIRDSAGVALRMVGTVQDITERKQMEEVLAFLANTGGASANEEFFHALARFLAEKLNMFYVCIDRLEGDELTARTVAVYCDGHFEDNVTYALKDTPCGDVVGQAVCTFPASVCQFFPRDQVLQDLNAESYVGVTLWGHTGQPIGLIAVIGRQQLADRALAETILKTVAVRAGAEMERLDAQKALMASEERFRTMFQEAPLGIAMIDTGTGHIQEMNRMFAKIVGGANADAEYASKDSLASVRLAEGGAKSAGLPLFETGQTPGFQKEQRLVRRDGSASWVSTTTAPLPIEDGTSKLNLCMLEDITERKRMEEQLVRSKRLEMAGQIAGQVAHDFNNLLSPMTAYPEMIRMELPKGHPANRYLDPLENAAHQMAAINEDLLALSRRGHFSQQPVVLNDLVEEALEPLSAAPKTLVIELDLAADLLPVSASAAQLGRVISNLLANARDAMADIGELRIKTENVYLDRDQLGYDRIGVGEYVRLQIQDTGCGLSPETQARMFEPFFTTKTTDRRRGTGLGLSIVQSIVQDHDGFIDVNSKVGIGTTFSVYFPICWEAVKAVPGVEVRRGVESILLVDDDAIQLEVAGTLLAKIGYRVNAVSSGEKAVAYLMDHPVDLVVLDMVMPGGLDGLQTYERIKEIRPEQRAVIVSGYAESDRVREAQALGVGAFLSKPITLQKLAKTVRDELDRR